LGVWVCGCVGVWVFDVLPIQAVVHYGCHPEDTDL
jgi:hypothetical protein